MSETEYDSLLETMNLLATPGFRTGFAQAVAEAEVGDTVSFDEVFGERQ
jgi:antitoxin YefM